MLRSACQKKGVGAFTNTNALVAVTSSGVERILKIICRHINKVIAHRAPL
jgi:hypothetical protein